MRTGSRGNQTPWLYCVEKSVLGVREQVQETVIPLAIGPLAVNAYRQKLPCE